MFSHASGSRDTILRNFYLPHIKTITSYCILDPDVLLFLVSLSIEYAGTVSMPVLSLKFFIFGAIFRRAPRSCTHDAVYSTPPRAPTTEMRCHFLSSSSFFRSFT